VRRTVRSCSLLTQYYVVRGKLTAITPPAPSPKPLRRSRRALEREIELAGTDRDKAFAHFALAVFHDNNSRKATAIPHYELALRYGLDGEKRAQCLAWLASSLYKTGEGLVALSRLAESRAATTDEGLMRFLAGLERRISRRLKQP
jgi:hypothetical protein